MRRETHNIEHEIWLTAYLTALRTHDPDSAQRVAVSAVKHYADRWSRRQCAAAGEGRVGVHSTGARGYLFADMNIPDQP